jgi:hypothetical protein
MNPEKMANGSKPNTSPQVGKTCSKEKSNEEKIYGCDFIPCTDDAIDDTARIRSELDPHRTVASGI